MNGRRPVGTWMVAAMMAITGTRLLVAASADPAPEPMRAVRSDRTATELLLSDGAARSATLRELVAELDRSDVLVYVSLGLDVPSAAGRTVLASSGGSRRVLRVYVNARLDTDRRLEILGHELTHCVEIARAPSVRTAGTLSAFERSIGWRTGSAEAFETAAARSAETRVRADLAADGVWR